MQRQVRSLKEQKSKALKEVDDAHQRVECHMDEYYKLQQKLQKLKGANLEYQANMKKLREKWPFMDIPDDPALPQIGKAGNEDMEEFDRDRCTRSAFDLGFNRE